MIKNRHYSAQRLSIEQITNLSNYCLQNASELIKEARLLFENKRYARSVFLSMVALEETSKRDITLQAILIGENEKQWGEFWEKFRSHRAKIAKMLQDYIVVDFNVMSQKKLEDHLEYRLNYYSEANGEITQRTA